MGAGVTGRAARRAIGVVILPGALARVVLEEQVGDAVGDPGNVECEDEGNDLNQPDHQEGHAHRAVSTQEARDTQRGGGGVSLHGRTTRQAASAVKAVAETRGSNVRFRRTAPPARE